MSDCKCNVTVVVSPPKKVIVETKNEISLPIVKVLVPGIQGPKGDQGPAGETQPLEIDPLQTYLKARGTL